MNDDLLIDLMLNKHQRAISFLEEYYSDKVGKKIKIRAVSSTNSFYDSHQSIVYISKDNLVQIAGYNQKYIRTMFYTLVLHEIGHAIYTNELPYNITRNILEDNRLEYQISQWNTRVQFKLLRYIFQDKLLAKNDLKNYDAVALSLLRTVDNTPFIKQLGTTGERMNIIKEILELNKAYQETSTELRLYSYRFNEEEYEPLIDISDKVEHLLWQLINAPKEEEQEENQDSQSSGDGDDNEEQDSSSETKQGAQDSPDIDTEEENGNADNQEMEKTLEELEEQMSELEEKFNTMKKDFKNEKPVLINPEKDTQSYTKYNITAFTTKRNSGIKGSRNVSRYSGNAKQLSLKKYMRRNHVPNEKMFEKPIEELSRGGKAATLSIYLDISGSMRGRRITIATDYIKSFYDTMNKHMKINLYAFGERTYKITRDELNLDFIWDKLEGDTILQSIDPHYNEEVVVITDGGIKNKISDQFKQRAHFVIIDVDQYVIDFIYGDVKNKHIVSSKNLVEGLNKATQGLKRLLS